MPAKWVGLRDEPILLPDSGSWHLDQNAAKCPASPLEPALRAVVHQIPQYDFTSLDVITDRWALATLLDWSANDKMQTPKPNSKGPVPSSDSSFSFGVQVVGDTVVFVRNDESKEHVVDRFKGFRSDIAKHYLKHAPGFEDSLSHYRVISYKLGGLRLMVRHAADGYIPEEAFGTEDITPAAPGRDIVQHDTLAVKSGGALVPRVAMIELNTYGKSGYSDEHMMRKLRHTWLSQQLHFIVAKWSFSRKQGKDYTTWRGTVKKGDLDLCMTHHGHSDHELHDQYRIMRFANTLQDLLKEIRERVAYGQGNSYVVQRAGLGRKIIVTSSENIPKLSEELCGRLSTKSK